MAPCTTKPGLRLVDPYTPIGSTSWGPIFHARGGRVGSSRGVDFMVDDSDDDGDPFSGDDDDDDDDDDDQDDEPDDQDDNGQDDEPQGRRRARPRDRRKRDEPADDEGDDGEELPTREQWASTRAALKRANNEAGRRRVLAKQLEKLGVDGDNLSDWLLERGIDPSSGGQITGDDEADGSAPADDEGAGGRRTGRSRVEVATELRRAEQRGRARSDAQHKSGMAMFAAEAAMHSAGWSGGDMALMLQLIDIGKIDVEFDGEVPTVYGLDEQIDRIKKEFPSSFRGGRGAPAPERRPARRASTGGAREVDGGERRRGEGRKPSWKDLVDAQITGRARR